ncbi:hypothetical protein [Novipirellula sp.]|uniref:hypothetical protein n=1 Tax=Novipirellula sp. TaxID=2795430 RepID=UPI00356A1590
MRWQVVHDEISKNDFVNESLRLEIDAMRKTQEFLTRNPLPGLDAHADGFYFQFLATPSRLDEYIEFLNRNKGRLEYDPRVYNASIYDSLRPQSTQPQGGG